MLLFDPGVHFTQQVLSTKVFSPSQHAYRRKRSCESALMDLDTLIQKGRNEHKTVGLVMTDMSAAFNLIKKDILIPLLRLYGFQVKALELVESYLTDRQTRCRIKKEISEPVTLDSGVGEGSVLGPVFFIIGMCAVGIVAKKTKELMAEKGHWVESWMLEFADDTSGMLICDNEEILQDAVDIMSRLFKEFFNAIGMCLNCPLNRRIITRNHSQSLTQLHCIA